MVAFFFDYSVVIFEPPQVRCFCQLSKSLAWLKRRIAILLKRGLANLPGTDIMEKTALQKKEGDHCGDHCEKAAIWHHKSR